MRSILTVWRVRAKPGETRGLEGYWQFWGRRHQSSLICPWQMGKEEPEKKIKRPALDCPTRYNTNLHLLGLQVQVQLRLRPRECSLRLVRLIRACACLL